MVFGLFSSDKDKKAKEEPKKAEPKSPKKAATPKSPKKADAKAASGPTKIDTFEKHVSLTWEDVPVQVWRCSETGLCVALAEVVSPTVNGYFPLVTEAHTDYGEPHTLEHLVFMGSKKYPYKGVLDELANRCLAQGTNAWTDVDNTTYTIETAGSEGFLNILPVYMDHILFPTITDAAFLTEIHHITEEGDDAGVVYCEMQARENEAEDRMDFALRRACYPDPKCGYRSETGGRLEELRDITAQRIRDYHKAYYRADNLAVLVTGQVPIKALLESLRPTVESCKALNLKPFPQPFGEKVQLPKENIKKEIEFPGEDEDKGAMVQFAWHGPGAGDLLDDAAYNILLKYLTHESVAPFIKKFVDAEPAYAGEVGPSACQQTVNRYEINFYNVTVKEMKKRDIEKEVIDLFKELVDKNGDQIDIERIRSILDQKERRLLSNLEGAPHEVMMDMLHTEFLYGKDFPRKNGEKVAGTLEDRMDKRGRIQKLLKWEKKDWAAFIKKWLLDDKAHPRVVVLGTPSKKCGKDIQAKDDARLKKQKKDFGEEKLKQFGKDLESANDENETDIPPEVVNSMKVPGADTITLIPVGSVVTKGGEIHSFGDESVQPCHALKAHMKKQGTFPEIKTVWTTTNSSQFSKLALYLPINDLDVDELLYLQLWCECAFELPIHDGDVKLTYEEVIQKLTEQTVSMGMASGRGGGTFCGTDRWINISVKADAPNFDKAVSWVKRVVFKSVFDKERLKIAATRMQATIPDEKRDARSLMSTLLAGIRWKDESSRFASNWCRMEPFLVRLLKSDFSECAEKLEGIRKKLAASHDVVAWVSGDINKMKDPVKPVLTLDACVQAAKSKLATLKTPFTKSKLDDAFIHSGTLKKYNGKFSAIGSVLTSSMIESNYLRIIGPSIDDAEHKELPALLVGIEYLTALEGPFWRRIRGKGFSYSYSLLNDHSAGVIQFVLFKSGDPVGAINAAKEVVLALCKDPADNDAAADEDDDGLGFDPVAMESARSGMIASYVSGVSTMPQSLSSQFGNWSSNLSSTRVRDMMSKCMATTDDEIRAAIKKYVKPLFDNSRCNAFGLLCPETSRAKIKKSLADLNMAHTLLTVDHMSYILKRKDGATLLRERIEKCPQITGEEPSAGRRGRGGAKNDSKQQQGEKGDGKKANAKNRKGKKEEADKAEEKNEEGAKKKRTRNRGGKKKGDATAAKDGEKAEEGDAAPKKKRDRGGRNRGKKKESEKDGEVRVSDQPDGQTPAPTKARERKRKAGKKDVEDGDDLKSQKEKKEQKEENADDGEAVKKESKGPRKPKRDREKKKPEKDEDDKKDGEGKKSDRRRNRGAGNKSGRGGQAKGEAAAAQKDPKAAKDGPTVEKKEGNRRRRKPKPEGEAKAEAKGEAKGGKSPKASAPKSPKKATA